MTIDRRSLLAASLAIPAAPALVAAAEPAETIPLWPGEAPGLINQALAERTEERGTAAVPDRSLSGIRTPRLEVFRAVKPNGTAMLVIPGGGYARVVVDKEGRELARWLAERGITAFVLYYRLPAEGWRNQADVSLADAQRAMRLIRASAKRFGLEAARTGVVGFSAGGHLCADLAVRHDRRVYEPVDAADRLDARPMIAAPIYPVVSMDPAIAHAGSRTNLLGADPSAAQMAEHSPDRQVTGATPPLFVLHAHDDRTVPVANALALHAAARAAGVPVELHLFERGGHGFGWGRRTAGLPVHLWPELWLLWARTHAFVS